MSPSLEIQPGTKGSRILGTIWVFWGWEARIVNDQVPECSIDYILGDKSMNE